MFDFKIYAFCYDHFCEKCILEKKADDFGAISFSRADFVMYVKRFEHFNYWVSKNKGM